MDMSPTRKLCENLIASAIRRCCISDKPCRLSVILKTCTEFDLPSTRIAISDTGVGSCLTEFQNVDYAKNQISAENWDGVLSITTTSTTDKEVYHYRLSLNETHTTKKLTRLPSTPKRGRNFSGTKVSLTTTENIIPWITHFCEKIAIMKIPKVAVELVVENMKNSGARCEQHLQADGILMPSSRSNIERLASGLEEFVLKHGNALDKESLDCFLSRENLKIGSGAAYGGKGAKGMPQMMEAVLVITGPKSSNPPSSYATSTEVIFFHNFAPGSIPLSCLNALTSIDWQNYGLTLRDHFWDENGNAVLQWEELPFAHLYIALHSYNIKMLQVQQRNIADKNLVKKAVKLALDDLKAKHPGLLLSQNAVKIQRYAPDLSKAIAGLILSSNDSEFQADCVTLLGLDSLDINEQGKIESCIRDKLLGIITMNDCKSSRGKLHGPRLFDDNARKKEEVQDEGDDVYGDANIFDFYFWWSAFPC